VKNVSQHQMKSGLILKVVGKVYPDLSVELLQFYQLQENFDLKLLNDMIPIIHHPQVSSMFFNSN
jgi:hypothetical protein